MSTLDLREFIAERLKQWDATADTSEGSAADILVVDPIIARLGSDPFETNIREFLRARFHDEYPEMDVGSSGSSWADILSGPLEMALEPFKRETLGVKSCLSIANPDQLTESEMDALGANYFEVRDYGGLARCVVRVFYYQPQKVAIDGTIYVTTAGGLRFYCAEVTTFSAEQMEANVEEDLYYIDFSVQAEREGDEYNVAKTNIVNVFGLPTAVKVTNITDATDGRPKETNARFLQRIQAGISQRALNTDRGIRAKLLTVFPENQALTTIGYGDVEMVRDIIRGVVSMNGDGFGLGPVLLEGTATPLAEDLPAASGQQTETFASLINCPAGGFQDPTNPILVGDVIHIDGVDRDVYDVISDNQLRVSDIINIFATAGADGIRNWYPLPRGSDLPITNLYTDTAARFGTYGKAGYYLVPYDGADFDDSDYKKIASLVSDWVVQIDAEIGIRRYGRAPGVFAPPGPGEFDFVLNYTSLGGGANPLAGDILDPTGAAAKLLANHDPTAKQLIVRCTTSAFNAGDVLAVNSGGTVTLDNPAVSRGASFDFVTSQLTLQALPDPAPYNFTSASIIGGTARIGDWVAITDEATLLVHGIFEVTNVVSDSILELTAVGAWPTALPGFNITQASWTVIDGDLFAAPQEFFSPDIGGEPFALFALADYAEYGTFDFLDHTAGVQNFSIRRRMTASEVEADLLLTISDIPGGILYPNTLQGTIEISDEEVHVGGMTDIFVKPRSVNKGFYTLPSTVDNDPILSGNDLSWLGGTDVVSSPSFVAGTDLTNMVLVIETGEHIGAYRIIYSTVGSIRIDGTLTNAGAGIDFYVTDGFTTDLSDPREIRIPYRGDLNTSLSRYVKVGTPGSYVDLVTDFGVQIGDTVEILDGPDEGTYLIKSIADSGETLELDSTLTWISTVVTFTIYRHYQAITRPLVRVTQVDLVDADGRDLGLTVPLKDPVDIRSGELSNAGTGLKVPNDTRATAHVDVGGFGTGGAGGYFDDSNATFITEGVVAGDVLVIEDGNNAGEYIVYSCSTNRITVEGYWPDDTDLTPSSYRVGSPSNGTLRLYFLDPTFFEVSDYLPALDQGQPTRFYLDDGREFRGDINARSLIASFTDETTDLYTEGPPNDDRLTSATINFRHYEIQAGDLAVLTTMRRDSADIATDTVNVSGTSLTLQFEDTASQTLIFQGSNPIALTESGYPGGVKEQIEAAFPDIVVEVADLGGPPWRLYFHSSKVFTFVGGSATGPLSLAGLVGLSNEHTHAGAHAVVSVAADGSYVRLANTFTLVLGTRAYFLRHRNQRIGPAAMTLQRDDLGLYYFDVEVSSTRPGNEYNLAADTQLFVRDHRSFGYSLYSRNEAYTFSDLEELDLNLTGYIMDPLLDDQFTDLIMLPGKELRFTIEYSDSIRDQQYYVTSDYNRVINNNPLVRHYKPAYVRTMIQYSRGSATSIIKKELVEQINGLVPTQPMAVFDLEKLLVRNKVERLENGPILILALVHQLDRTILGMRTLSRMSSDRLTHVIADEDWIRLVKVV